MTNLELNAGIHLVGLIGQPAAVVLLGHGKIHGPAVAVDGADDRKGLPLLGGHGEQTLNGGLIALQRGLQLFIGGSLLGSGGINLGNIPPGTVNLPLRRSIGTLSSQSGQSRITGNLFGLLGSLVGGTPAHGVEPGKLALLVGQVQGKLLQNGGLHGIGLGLDTHQLVAGEGAKVVRVAVHGEAGQIGAGVVVAQSGLGGAGAPGADDDDGGGDGGGEVIGRAGGLVSGGVQQLLHALQGDNAVVGVEVVVNALEALAVGGHGPVGVAAGSEEEGDIVPRGGLKLHGEAAAGGLAVGNDVFQAVHVLSGNHAAVVNHEVAVIGGHGIAPYIGANGGGRNGAAVVQLGDFRGSLGAKLGQGAGLHQTSQLILREAEQVGAVLDGGDHLGGGLGLGDALNGGVDDDAGVLFHKVLDLLLGQFLYTGHLGDPDGDVIGAVQRIGRGSGGGVGSGGGAGGGCVAVTAAGKQAKNHADSQKQRENLLHFTFPP